MDQQWRQMSESRFQAMFLEQAARNRAEDAWKAQSEARLKAGEDFQVRENVRKQRGLQGGDSDRGVETPGRCGVGGC